MSPKNSRTFLGSKAPGTVLYGKRLTKSLPNIIEARTLTSFLSQKECFIPLLHKYRQVFGPNSFKNSALPSRQNLM